MVWRFPKAFESEGSMFCHKMDPLHIGIGVINLSRVQHMTEIATARTSLKTQKYFFLIVRLEQNSEKDTSSKPCLKIGHGWVITRWLLPLARQVSLLVRLTIAWHDATRLLQFRT